MKKQKGFTAIEGLLILLLVGIVSGAGWYIYSANHKANQSLNNATSVSASSSAKYPSCSANNQTYLSIDEWGVKAPLCDGITDLYYKMNEAQATAYIKSGGGVTAALFRTKALDNLFYNCAANSVILTRGKADDKYIYPDYKTISFKDAFQAHKTVNGISPQHIGDYYYMSAGPSGWCSITGKYNAQEQQIVNTIHRALSQLKIS